MNARRLRSASVVAILCVFAQTAETSLAATPRAARAIRAEAAWTLARAALAEFQAGRYAQAAELYEKAWRADPKSPGYLFGVGRAEQKAGRWQAAVDAFEKLLSLLPAGGPLALRARKALNAVKATAHAAARQPVAATPAPVELPASATPAEARVEVALPATPVALSEPPSPTVAPAPPVPLLVSVAHPSSAWLAAGLGAASLLGAGAMATNAWQADREAERYRFLGSGQFDPAKISESDAATRIDAINENRGLAIGLAVVAVSAAGVWFWLTRRDISKKGKAIP